MSKGKVKIIFLDGQSHNFEIIFQIRNIESDSKYAALCKEVSVQPLSLRVFF